MQTRTAVTWACVLGVTGVAPAGHAQEITGSSDWQIAATLYGWLPDIGGHTQLPLGGSGDIDVDVGTILDHLKMTAQGSFELRKGRWGAFTDLVYLDVGETGSRTRNITIGGRPIPATVDATLQFDLKSTIWTLAGTYLVTSGSDTTFEVLAGARLAHINQGLGWTFNGNFNFVTPPPITGDAKESVDQWDAIIGGQGRIALGAGHKWAIPYYFDIGTGDSDLTWQAEAGITYSFGWGDIGAVWRYLDYDLKSNGPIKDLSFNGPAVGATIRW